MHGSSANEDDDLSIPLALPSSSVPRVMSIAGPEPVLEGDREESQIRLRAMRAIPIDDETPLPLPRAEARWGVRHYVILLVLVLCALFAGLALLHDRVRDGELFRTASETG